MTNEPDDECPGLLEGIFKILFQFTPRHLEEKICPQCHTTISEARSTGQLGCPQCQETFAPELDYFFTQSPKTETTTQEELTTRLQDAIKKEDYELAAILRDKIKELN